MILSLSKEMFFLCLFKYALMCLCKVLKSCYKDPKQFLISLFLTSGFLKIESFLLIVFLASSCYYKKIYLFLYNQFLSNQFTEYSYSFLLPRSSPDGNHSNNNNIRSYFQIFVSFISFCVCCFNNQTFQSWDN